MTRLDTRIVEYEELKVLKQSGKSTVHLVREKGGEQVFVRKKLKGRHPVYSTLQNCEHPFLPKLYEVITTDESTTIIEEYIEGIVSGSAELSGKQFLNIVKDLCSVLEFLHGKGIIHRDIKPSNIILAKDGHIRLIDFDAARMPKNDLEQDTRLLGTRGYAPPEQYGFSQTDERADIYAMGVTLEQLLGKLAQKPRYKRIIRKCTDLNPDKRYQSARQVRNAFFRTNQSILCAVAVAVMAILVCSVVVYQPVRDDDVQSESTELIALPSPAAPHWDGETGIALWGNVFESGNEEDGVAYNLKLYRSDTATPPDLDKSVSETEENMSGHVGDIENFMVNLSPKFEKNGFYYFAVSAIGDGVNYTDSPYIISDVFEYTGESAPTLPAPTGLEWKMVEGETQRNYFATWSNFDDYEDKDTFDVYVYDKSGNYIMNNYGTKEDIISLGWPEGVRIRGEFVSGKDNAYRFVVKVYSSRPNEYKSYTLPDPVPEEYYSPWLNRN